MGAAECKALDRLANLGATVVVRATGTVKAVVDGLD